MITTHIPPASDLNNQVKATETKIVTRSLSWRGLVVMAALWTISVIAVSQLIPPAALPVPVVTQDVAKALGWCK